MNERKKKQRKYSQSEHSQDIRPFALKICCFWPVFENHLVSSGRNMFINLVNQASTHSYTGWISVKLLVLGRFVLLYLNAFTCSRYIVLSVWGGFSNKT